jgi:hypothetical protein
MALLYFQFSREGQPAPAQVQAEAPIDSIEQSCGVDGLAWIGLGGAKHGEPAGLLPYMV